MQRSQSVDEEEFKSANEYFAGDHDDDHINNEDVEESAL